MIWKVPRLQSSKWSFYPSPTSSDLEFQIVKVSLQHPIKIYFILFLTLVIYIHIYTHVKSQDSSVRVATDYRLDGLGLIPYRDKKHFSSPQHPGRHWSSPSFLSNGYRGGLFLGVRRPGREDLIYTCREPKRKREGGRLGRVRRMGLVRLGLLYALCSHIKFSGQRTC
jgi:hypothetical protein